MPKKRDLTDEEKKILAEAMRDVTPLDASELIEKPMKKPASRILKKAPAKSIPAPAKITAPSAIDTQTQNKIRRGEYAISGKLDLHGFTLERAYERLEQFIETHHHKGSRCLLVITGKGGKSGEKGLLQQDVPHWLSHANMSRMVAFHTTAQAKHGGAGALYVYLKRKR